MGSSVELGAVLTPSVIEEIDYREANIDFSQKGKEEKKYFFFINYVSNITLASDMLLKTDNC